MIIVVDCGLLSPPIEGFIDYVNDTTTYLSVVSYSCSPRYGISGSELRTCLSNGSWSGRETECVGKNSIHPMYFIL